MKSKAARIADFVTGFELQPRRFPLVYGIVNTQVRRSGTPVDNDDILGEAFLGLVRAADKYSKKRAKPSTFATIKVESAVKDLIRREAILARRLPQESIDDLTTISIGDCLEDVAAQQMGRAMHKVMHRTLNTFEFKVVTQYFWQDMQNDEIAHLAKCSVSLVNKTKQRALNKLRVAFTNRGIPKCR